MVAGIGVACSATIANAQSADALMDKLVEKGVLSVKEANDLREQADKNFTTAYSVKSGLPEWVSALRFNGDFRGRIDGIYAEDNGFTDRSRARYRLRFGAVASLFNNFEVGLRLGSGELDSYPRSGIDPISNNQTFSNNGSKKGIFIDQAYAKWTALNSEAGTASLIFGKMENPFVFSDILFDQDYTPEGLAVQTSFPLSDKHTLKPTAAAFMLDELAGEVDDPMLFAGQVRLDSAWSKKISTTAGVSILSIANEEFLTNTDVPNVNAGNTRNDLGAPAYDFHPVVGDLGFTYLLDSFPMAKGAFPIRVGGDYIYNEGAPSEADNTAWSAGVTFGKAGKKGAWEIGYTYKWVGANAWWEELADSDFGAYYPSALANSGRSAEYSAGTNLKGHVTRIAYSPLDSLTLSLKWAFVDQISSRDTSAEGGFNGKTHRLQLDAMLKF